MLVSNWECVRSTSYIFPESVAHELAAAAYVARRLQARCTPVVGRPLPRLRSSASSSPACSTRSSQLAGKYTSVSSPGHESPPLRLLARLGLQRQGRARPRNPDRHELLPLSGRWIGCEARLHDRRRSRCVSPTRRRADRRLAGEHQHRRQGGSSAHPAAPIDTLLDKALGRTGFYGVFTANMHTDYPSPHPGADTIVAAALSRGVPVVSYKQMLDWTDGRDDLRRSGVSTGRGTS